MLSRAKCAAPRALRSNPAYRSPKNFKRFQSTSSSSNTGSFSVTSLSSGILGGVVGAAIFYGAYSYTPAGRTASKLNKAAVEAEKQYKIAASKLQSNTPDANQAINYIREFAYSYVGWIPGGRSYVDAAFKDIDLIREKHKEEADKIVNDAYKKLQDISKSGLSMETVSKVYEAIADMSKKIASLSGDAFSDILDNHPQAKEKLGGNVDKLKQLGEQYGPEAKKQVDETWNQVKDIFAGGFSPSSLKKAKELVDEKVEKLQKMGDEVWKKGLEEVKPYLDKSPKVKELLEKNADVLKQGNVKELFDKARSAVDSGDIKDLQKYVESASQKVKSKGQSVASEWNLDQYFQMIPQGSEILPKLQELSQVAKEHKEEGEKLLKETIQELKQVLDKKSKEAKDLAESGKQEVKSEAKST